MSRVMLHQIQMKRQSKSYVDSLHAILTAAGLFAGPKYMLAGLSGMAFKFAVHRKLLSFSVSAYGQWGNEHDPAIENLGLFTIRDAGRTRHATYPYYQADAVKWVKQSLDAGVGVIYWIPEFGVICGYDDEDEVFYVQDGWNAEHGVVLYDNFGLNFTPFWYCQMFGERVEIDLAAMVLESLRLAIYDWETPHKTLPDTEIASGKLAFSFFRNGLANEAYDERGAVYILEDYVYTRGEIADYLHDVQDTLPGLEEAAARYAELRGVLSAVHDCWTTGPDGKRIDPERTEALCSILLQAEALEERAIAVFRSVSARFPDRKRSIIPRWGANSAR
ncbi:BtrH N-terminal domain-containing protein [Paenibacillus rhizovicinus]|uniref:BtrH N-terminal domain-containing protein n=1 Tax=Paenibacillus rhizovicinus TaxID=2704463 RepID=A0A6C0NZW9_9BACL|nr:BtrH N-terminal domain-containing protein [Paenibacillus rhizovicinus]QHW31661.1 BtrH N-terminal domain-containing protein [Paenibacillus rhizovicinus]